MSRERLQEHFSELFEGTIDPGLSQQIKTRFDGDYDLKADYEGFVDTMALLETMKDEKIDTPPHLSSMIADRLEANAKKPAASLSLLWRNLGFGALACVAIGSAVFAVKNNSANEGPAQASLGPNPVRVAPPIKVIDTLEVKMVKTNPTLTYNSSGPKTITILNHGDQSLNKKYNLADGQSMECPLVNPGEQPAVFEIEATAETAKHLVILPGSGMDFEAAGSGDLVDFAKLLATKYRVSVHIQVPKDVPSDLKWDVSQSDPKEAAKAVLGPSEYTVTGDSSIIVIQKQSH